MRDLYRDLGLQPRAATPAVIQNALSRARLNLQERENASFVLLDRSRKAHYDWVLARAMELAEARSRLGLSTDPSLVASPAPPGPSGRTTLPVPRSRRPLPAWLAWAFGAGLLLALTLVRAGIWISHPPTPPAPSPANRPSGTTVPAGGPPQPTKGPDPAGEPEPVPPPSHGWLLAGSELQSTRPWSIVTDAGQDYLVTLLDAKSQAPVLTLFLKGGEPYQGAVPLGGFELMYTSGTSWFGLERGFGPDAKKIRPGLTYRVQSGPGETGAWTLKLHPTSCEGIPVPLKTPETPSPNRPAEDSGSSIY